MKRVYMLMVILSISACIPSGPAMTLLVNPKTGERITCRAAILVDQSGVKTAFKSTRG